MATTEIPKSVPMVDGWTGLIGGMDANRRPRLIDQNQYSLGINITTRGGFPQTRPSILYRALTFQNDENEEWFKTQIFQGAFNYTYVGASKNISVSKEVLVCMVGGRLWKIDKCSLEVEELTPGGRAGRNSRCGSIAYFVQAEQWLVVQDGTSAPILWDGGVARRSNTANNEVPVGTIMAYGQGRIWLISGPQLLAGDLVGSYPNAVIGFTEQSFLATNGKLFPSYTIGEIRALQFIPQQDTATGVGSLLVIGDRGVSSVYAEKERSEWVTGISRVTLINIGGTGHRNVTSINGDVWIECPDGWRSYRHARGEQDKWYQLPMSEEVSIFTDTTAENIKPYSSAIFYDNRLLATVGAIWQNGRASFRGLIALDFNVLSTFGEATKPAWEGLWTGVNIMQFVRTIHSAFIFGIDESGSTALYEITKTADTPIKDLRLGGPRAIECELVTGAYVFTQQQRSFAIGASAQKQIENGDIFLRDMKDRCIIDVEFRRDGEPCFSPWNHFDVCADADLCDVGCSMIPYAPQYRNRLRLGDPRYTTEEECDVLPNQMQQMSFFYEIQQRVLWTGRMTLSLARMFAVTVDEQDPAGCLEPEIECVKMPMCCYDPYNFTPRFPPYELPPFPPSHPGCTDPTAINYDPLADPGDGSCMYPRGGCTDPTAFNFDPLATFDDGTCVPRVYGCTDSGATNYNPEANTDDGSCIPCVYGCTDSGSSNYDPDATCDDGSCESPSGAPAGCCCDLVTVPTPPNYIVPYGAPVDCELISYPDNVNVTPSPGYKLVVGQEIINGVRGRYFSLICNSGTAPVLLGTRYFDDADGIWFDYDPIGTLPGGSNAIYIVYFYSTGMNVWYQCQNCPGYNNGPARQAFLNGGVYNPNIDECMQ